MVPHPPSDAVAQAKWCAQDLRSFEYREQIHAARTFQKLGVAAAPYAELLVGRLEDPNFQMRRACCETIRLIAEISKELALDKAEAEAEAAKAAAEAEAALAAKAAAELAQLEADAAAGIVRRRSKRASSKVALMVAGGLVVPGEEEGGHSRQPSKQSHHDEGGHSRQPSKHSHRAPSHAHSEALHGELGDIQEGADHHHDEHHHHHHHHHAHHPDGLPEDEPKVHKAGWFSGKDHDDHSDKEGEEGEEGEDGQDGNHGSRRHSKSHHRPSFSQEGVEGAEGDQSHRSRAASKLSHRSDHSRAHTADEGASPKSHNSEISADKASNAESWVSSESSESEEECITPRSAAAMADPRSAVVPYVGQLASALGDKTWQVRLAAARALAAIGGSEIVDDETAMEAVKHCTSDEHEEVRCAACEVFEALGAAGSLHAAPVVAAIQDPGDAVRAQALKAVGAMGRTVPAQCRHMRVLTDTMQNDVNDIVRMEAAKALGKQGRAPILYISELVAAVKSDPCIWVKNAAMDVIVQLGTPATPHVATLLDCDIEVQRGAVKTLGLGIVDLLEDGSDARTPVIAEKLKTKIKVQEAHFLAKRQARQEAKDAARKAHRDECRAAAEQNGREYLTPDEDTDDEENDSEEPIAEEDMEDEANKELDAEITSYVEAIAAKLLSFDEQLRQIAIEALKRLQAVVEPHTGRQMLVWQDGHWTARLVADYM